MRTRNLFLVPALIAALNLMPARHATAQTFKTLHSFTAGIFSNSDQWPYYFNSDGFAPTAGLVLSGNTLYGTAGLGGWWGSGTLFAVNTDATGFTNLHNFELPDMHGGYVPETNPDGINPNGLILSGNTLYGTAEKGGWVSDNGTLFAVNTDNTGFTNLHSFTGSGDGSHPSAGLISSGNALYGTTSGGLGAVFAVNTNGTGSTTLHGFSGGSNGANPRGGLILSGSTLYGTTSGGGSGGVGMVFAVNTNGTGFTNLHSFTVSRTNSSGLYTNSDGANPQAGLILSGNTLYGTTYQGGSSGYGTVFALNKNGTGFTNLHSFTGSNGAFPYAGLILWGNTLYGTASGGGVGTVFAVYTNGTGFTNLHRFTDCSINSSGAYTNSDGANPHAGLILSGNTLYGTTYQGGSFGGGTVFSFSFRPQLTITSVGAKIILSWPTNVAGFDCTGYTLQSTTNPISSAVWSTNSPAPVVIAGRCTVTNAIPGPRQFYRLVQ